MKRLNQKRLILVFVFFVCLLLINCAHYPKNDPLKPGQETIQYNLDRLTEASNEDKTFVALAFSGGGTRAAAFSYGVLDRMRRVILPGTAKTLLDEVDVVSTVSGGSFTGAYYALFGNRIFNDFKDKLLYRDIEKELALKVLNPINIVRLASPYYNRIDLAAELYDKTIFESKTFHSLVEQRKRPFLIINATNLFQGARFEFTSRQFRYLNSNLLTYPIARAVAASSAFPFLLAPLSLVNHYYPDGGSLSEQDRQALMDYEINKRRYYEAYNNVIYTREKDAKKHPYIHLSDGGLADNLGLRVILDLFVQDDIRRKINNGEIKRFLTIVVNAKTTKPEDLDMKETPPGLFAVGIKTCTVSMDNYTFETVEAFRDQVEERGKAQRSLDDCQEKLDKYCGRSYHIPPLSGGSLKPYVVDLSFENIIDEAEKEFFNNLPTTFSLEKTEVDRLIEVGGRLLVSHPEFQRFLKEYSD